MKFTAQPKHPLVQLPHATDLLLFLIGEELKSHRLALGLQQAGLDYSPYLPHLNSAIFRELGLNEGSDETHDLYYQVLQAHAQKIDASRESVTQHAIQVYETLVAQRGRLSVNVGEVA